MNEIDLLKKLISYNSCSRENANELLIYCKEWLLENNIAYNILENNGYKILISSIGSGNKTLVFNGHLDVVSGKKSSLLHILKAINCLEEVLQT